MPQTQERDVRSNYVTPRSDQLSSATAPCEAPEGHWWIHAFNPAYSAVDATRVGKWLIRVGCNYVQYCWQRVREATEAGDLGIGSKVSTDLGDRNDIVSWAAHTVCVYTRDWRDCDDVLRFAKALKTNDAVRTRPIYYKPDTMTYEGIWELSSPGKVAIYTFKPPYNQLVRNESALALASSLEEARE